MQSQQQQQQQNLKRHQDAAIIEDQHELRHRTHPAILANIPLDPRQPVVANGLAAGGVAVGDQHLQHLQHRQQSRQSNNNNNNNSSSTNTNANANVNQQHNGRDGPIIFGAAGRRRQQQQQHQNGCLVPSNSRRKLLELVDPENELAKREIQDYYQLEQSRLFGEFLDELTELSDEDKLKLSTYLAQFERCPGAHLSELLNNLLQNILIRFTNPAVKYQLLSFIKRIYIEPRLRSADDIAAAAAADQFQQQQQQQPFGCAGDNNNNNKVLDSQARRLDEMILNSDQKFKLDLRLFEAMLHQYQVASLAGQSSIRQQQQQHQRQITPTHNELRDSLYSPPTTRGQLARDDGDDDDGGDDCGDESRNLSPVNHVGQLCSLLGEPWARPSLDRHPQGQQIKQATTPTTAASSSLAMAMSRLQQQQQPPSTSPTITNSQTMPAAAAPEFISSSAEVRARGDHLGARLVGPGGRRSASFQVPTGTGLDSEPDETDKLISELEQEAEFEVEKCKIFQTSSKQRHQLELGPEPEPDVPDTTGGPIPRLMPMPLPISAAAAATTSHRVLEMPSPIDQYHHCPALGGDENLHDGANLDEEEAAVASNNTDNGPTSRYPAQNWPPEAERLTTTTTTASNNNNNNNYLLDDTIKDLHCSPLFAAHAINYSAAVARQQQRQQQHLARPTQTGGGGGKWWQSLDSLGPSYQPLISAPSGSSCSSSSGSSGSSSISRQGVGGGGGVRVQDINSTSIGGGGHPFQLAHRLNNAPRPSPLGGAQIATGGPAFYQDDFAIYLRDQQQQQQQAKATRSSSLASLGTTAWATYLPAQQQQQQQQQQQLGRQINCSSNDLNWHCPLADCWCADGRQCSGPRPQPPTPTIGRHQFDDEVASHWDRAAGGGPQAFRCQSSMSMPASCQPPGEQQPPMTPITTSIQHPRQHPVQHLHQAPISVENDQWLHHHHHHQQQQQPMRRSALVQSAPHTWSSLPASPNEHLRRQQHQQQSLNYNTGRPLVHQVNQANPGPPNPSGQTGPTTPLGPSQTPTGRHRNGRQSRWAAQLNQGPWRQQQLSGRQDINGGGRMLLLTSTSASQLKDYQQQQQPARSGQRQPRSRRSSSGPTVGPRANGTSAGALGEGGQRRRRRRLYNCLDNDHYNDDDDDGDDKEEADEEEDEDDELLENESDESDEPECVSLVPSQARDRLPIEVAEEMSELANRFVRNTSSASHRSHSSASSSVRPTSAGSSARARHHRSSAAGAGPARREQTPGGSPKRLQVRRTLRVKIRKSKPILGIAIEGGFNVSGQLLPRIVCVHEEGAAYQCGKLRASDLILEINGISTVNMTHDDIAKTIANAYYQDDKGYIEFLIGESVHV